MEPRWLTIDMVIGLHGENVADFGGDPTLRDAGLLESALERPRNLLAYGDEPSIPALAAAYCAGIVRNHPFIDGNKRTGFLAANAFLVLNGFELRPREADVVRMIMALAAGDLEDTALAGWIDQNTVRLED